MLVAFLLVLFIALPVLLSILFIRHWVKLAKYRKAMPYDIQLNRPVFGRNQSIVDSVNEDR
jgi:hypothetical protein